MDPSAYRASERALWDELGVLPRESFLDLERPSVRVRVQEVGDGPPVVFVHGGPNAGTTFATLAARLPHLRCIILDRPGCGLSEPVDYRSDKLDVLAVDILTSLLDALALERADVVASSVGGLWSIWLALARPERLGRMVQLGATAGMPGLKVPLFMRLMSTPGLNRLMTAGTPSVKMMQSIYRQIGHGRSVRAGVISDAYWAWTVALGVHTETMKHELRLVETAVSPFVGMRACARLQEDDLRALRLPLLWLWGDADPFGDVSVLARARAATNDSAASIVEGGGHLPWLDDPARAAAAVTAHLAGGAP